MNLAVGFGLMSRAYKQFLAELQAEAPAKKDGFDLENIRKLAGSERIEARGLLQHAVIDGDNTAVDALVQLDGAEGLSFLRSQLQTPDEMLRARIVRTLLETGRDPDAEQAIAPLLTSRHSVVRHDAIWALRHVWSDEDRIAALVAVLRVEPSSSNRLSAASELLRALGRKLGDARTPEFREALNALRGADVGAWERMLAALGV